MSTIRPLSISLSPNTESDDVLLALRLLFQPWLWRQGQDVALFDLEFAQYLGLQHTLSFNSARSAFYALLKSLELEQGDEILIQAFTCNAVPNPVLWAGFKPVYVDCREDYNMDPADLEKKITQRSKVVVVQHTFGLPADMDQIQEICKRHNLLLIEDCAHALGATYRGKLVGSFGDVSFFSFSRDKVLSCVYGGMLATNNEALGEKVRRHRQAMGQPPLFWVFQQLLHPVVMNWVVLPTYSVFGKYLLVLFQQFHLLSKAVHWKEKQGKIPGYFPKALPNALAVLARKQLQKLERFNAHRKEIAEYYAKELSNTSYKLQDTRYKEGNIFLRLPIQHPQAHEIIKKAWSQSLLLGDWYTTPVAPHDTKIEKMEYQWGSCPTAEHLAKVTLNLPTHIRIQKKDAKTIVEFLKSQAP